MLSRKANPKVKYINMLCVFLCKKSFFLKLNLNLFYFSKEKKIIYKSCLINLKIKNYRVMFYIHIRKTI